MKKFIIALVISALCLSWLPSQPVLAADTGSWQAGRIIDDVVFTDSSTLSAADIMNFLESKLPSCDTNGAKSHSYYYNPSTGRVNDEHDTWVTTSRATYGQRVYQWKVVVKGLPDDGSRAPYTCLKDYTKSGDTSAEIIRQAAIDYDINPQALLVLLQKEQSLITDDWPWKIQFREATGYCVTDDEDNPKPCSSDTYNFKSQIRNGARLWREILDNPSSSNYPPGVRSIYYNPNPSCGSSNVNIVTAATSALYHYTPYQPNAATLAADPGVEVPCGAYGNLNFWRYFTDWFGSVYGSYRLIECGGNNFIVERGIRRKRPVNTEGLEAWGLEGSFFNPGDSGCSYPSYDLPLARLVKSRESGRIYFIDGQVARRVRDQSIASAWGLGDLSASIAIVKSVTLKTIDVRGDLTRLAKSATTDKVYLIDSQKRHLIVSTNPGTGVSDSLELIRGKGTVPMATYTGNLLKPITPGADIDYSFSTANSHYVFDHGKIRKVRNANYESRWQHIDSLTGPTLSTDFVHAMPRERYLGNGFRRGRYFLVRLGDKSPQITSTGSLAQAKHWGIEDAPLITSMLANRLMGN